MLNSKWRNPPIPLYKGEPIISAPKKPRPNRPDIRYTENQGRCCRRRSGVGVPHKIPCLGKATVYLRLKRYIDKKRLDPFFKRYNFIRSIFVDTKRFKMSGYFLLAFPVFIIYRILLEGKLENILEKKFPKVFKELGLDSRSPLLIHRLIATNSFIRKKEYLKNNDPELTKCCKTIKSIDNVGFLYTLFFFSYKFIFGA